MECVLFSCQKISYTLIRVNLMSLMNNVMTLSIITTTFYKNVTIMHYFHYIFMHMMDVGHHQHSKWLTNGVCMNEQVREKNLMKHYPTPVTQQF